MTEELKKMIKRLCNQCAKENYKFDMKFTYDRKWTDLDYCY